MKTRLFKTTTSKISNAYRANLSLSQAIAKSSRPLFYTLLLLFTCLLSNSNIAIAQVSNTIAVVKSDCINQNAIDPDAVIPAIYAPVCGCDGRTYPNAETAKYRHGITSWTNGACNSCELEAIVANLDVDCDGGDVCVLVSGGVAPYTFILGNQVSSTTTTDLEICFQNLEAGNYFLRIKDMEGCQTTLEFSIPVVDYFVDARIKNVSCFGGEDGAIELDIDIDIPLLYRWTGPNGFSATTEDIYQLVAGIYTVQISTLDGECYATASFEVKQPRALEATFMITSEACGDGVDGCLKVAGGTQPYKLWVFQCPTPLPSLPEPTINANGAVEVDGMVATNDLVFANSTSTIDYKRCAEDIPAGIYYVLVVDANRCWTYLRVEIPEVTGLRLEGEVEHVSCFGGSDGAIELKIDGGAPPYHIRWEKEDGTTGTDLTNLTAGAYKVWVFDAHQCTAHATFIVRQPDKLQAEFEITNQNCNEGTDGCLKIQGGTMPYRLWVFRCPNPQPIQPQPVFDTNGQPQVDGMNLTDAVDFGVAVLAGDEICAKDIPAGIYYVLIVDANRCWVFKRIEIEDQPGLELNLEFDPYGARACVHPEGGTAPYIVGWFDFASGQEIVATNDFCVNNLSEGIYLVEVSDANGCIASEIFIIEPAPCGGGIATVDPAEILSGENTTFSLQGHSGISLQWQFKTDFTEWLDIQGATEAQFVTPPISVSVDKRIAVRAVVTCADGNIVFSTVAILTVLSDGTLAPQSPAMDRQLFSTPNTPTYFEELVTTYPSVTDGRLNVRMNSNARDARITVTDFRGKRQELRRLEAVREGQVERLDLSGLPSGTYLIRIEMMGTFVTKRVILQRL